MNNPNQEEFISEGITPASGTADKTSVSHGEPGLPESFTWRGLEYRVAGLIEKWKSSGPCHSGGRERYLRRHWYRILTDPPLIMTIYCERQPSSRKTPQRRWWLYSIRQVTGK